MSQPKRIGVMMKLDQGFKRHLRVFSGIHEYARQHADWKLTVDEWADHSLPSRAGQPNPFDGVVGRITSLGARRARRLDVPVVNVWLSSPAKNLPGVYPDHHASGRLIAEHLLGRGFRNLGALVGDFDRVSQLQADAMEATAAAAQPSSGFRKLTLGWESGFVDGQRSVRAITRWMKTWQPPIGLLIREFSHARLIIDLARDFGWKVPEQLAIVCCFNDEIQCERPEPGLTSVEVPDEQCGYEAAKMLDHLIDAKRQGVSPFAEPRTVLLPPVGVVARHSTDFFAVNDPLVRDALRYIAEHLAKPFNAESVAGALAVSRRTLDARFHEKLGRTVADEIQRLRIEGVKRKLVSADLTIAQLARSCGFGSVRTLNDQFMRVVGVSPGDFRKQAAARR